MAPRQKQQVQSQRRGRPPLADVAINTAGAAAKAAERAETIELVEKYFDEAVDEEVQKLISMKEEFFATAKVELHARLLALPNRLKMISAAEFLNDYGGDINAFALCEKRGGSGATATACEGNGADGVGAAVDETLEEDNPAKKGGKASNLGVQRDSHCFKTPLSSIRRGGGYSGTGLASGRSQPYAGEVLYSANGSPFVFDNGLITPMPLGITRKALDSVKKRLRSCSKGPPCDLYQDIHEMYLQMTQLPPS